LFTATELRESIEIYKYGYIVSNLYPIIPNVPSTPETDKPVDTEEGFETEPPVDPEEPKDTEKPSDTDCPLDTEEIEGVIPEETEPEDTEPEDTEPEYSFDPSKPLTYEEYLALSAQAQEAYGRSFSNPLDFFTWLEQAKAEYDAKNPSIEVGGDGNIDIGDIIG
jgi:hypothetical protein